ncbi:trypsin-like serine protease [Streptomyces sp. NPDC055632]
MSLMAFTMAATTLATPATALTGTDAPAQLNFTAKIVVGEKSSCTGALVDPQWVLTAKSCFTAAGISTAGKPAVATTVTVGRNDLTETGGSVQQALTLVSHPDRDLTLVRLSTKVGSNVTPVRIATTPAAAGEQLTKAGFGRTKTEWVPNKLHTGTFTVASTTGTDVNLNGSETATVCQGDAGGPALRMVNGTPELVAVGSRSWQGGCLGTDPAETRTNAVDTRVDDVAGWIQQIRLAAVIPDMTEVMTTGDFNKDGRSDIAVVTADGNLHAAYGRADGTFEYGRPLWKLDGSWKTFTDIVAGDYNGDGNTDIAAVWGGGSLQLYAGNADGTLAPAKKMWPDGFDWRSMLQIARYKVDNSGRDGLLAVWSGGSLYGYHTDANGLLTEQKRQMWPDTSWKSMKILTTGDINTDTRDDVVAVSPNGYLVRYDGNASGTLNSGVDIWPDNGWGGIKIYAGDYNGDKKTDLLGRWGTNLNFYKGDGKGTFGTSTKAWPTLP